MFLSKHQSLEEHIVFVLGSAPSADVKTLTRSLRKQGREYTIQAIYKELRKLQQEGVVTKVGHTYNLRLSWVLRLMSVGEEIFQKYTEPPMLAISWAVQSKQSWQLNSLIQLMNFWDNLLLSLVQSSSSKQLFGFTRHAWYHLAQLEAENQYIAAMRKSGGMIYLVLGSRRPLDTWAENFWPKETVEFGYSKSLFAFDPSIEFDVIDDYIITAKKDQATTAWLEELYATYHTPLNISTEVLWGVFNHRAKIKITIEKNALKASRLRKRFARFFGVHLYE